MNNNAVTLTNFFYKGRQLKYRKGEIILSPYETSSSLFYLGQGFVKHYSLTEGGNEKCYMFYSAGQLFYLLPKIHLSDKDNFFTAMTEVIVYKTTITALKDFLHNYPQNTPQFIDILFDSLNNFITRIDNLEIADTHTRIITRLLLLINTFGIKNGDEIIIPVPVTHKDIANTINTTRETVSRELGLLEKKKIITFKGRQIICNDVEMLKGEIKKQNVS